VSDIEVSKREKGSFLEDTVADYFRHLGFEVEPRVKLRDKYDVEHEIDVLARRTEALGTIRIAVECKYVKSSIDIKEVRNFHDKLMALNITKGLFISTAGFTTEAAAHAKSLGIELWDLKTLQDKIGEVSVPEEKVIRDALPMSSDFRNFLLPDHIKNRSLLSSNIRLSYAPFYFATYHCVSQHKVVGNDVLLESKGYLVLDAITGNMVSSQCLSTYKPQIVELIAYNDCLSLKPQTVDPSKMPESVEIAAPRIDAVQAKKLITVGLIKALTTNYGYQVSRARFPYSETRYKTLQPKSRDIEIEKIRLTRIPLCFVTLSFMGRQYSRILQVATNRLVYDDTWVCGFRQLACQHSPVVLCENCGLAVCDEHSKNCMVCGKPVCNICAVSKGFISRKYYCPQHKPE
jgi:hypothetical protein